MTTDKTEVPAGVREFADKSVEQARGAVGTLLDAARKTAETIQSTTKTGDTPEGQAVARGFGFAQQNISAIFDFAQQLVRAPDLKEAARLQADFVRDQAAVMEKQVEELKSLRPDKA
jgi:phasin